MEAITDYLPEIQEEEDVTASSRSSLSDGETGFIEYAGSPRSSTTDTDMARSSDDFDVSEIRVEVHKAATPPLLPGTTYRQPHPPTYRPRTCQHNFSPRSVDVHFGPYYEERGEVSGHYDDRGSRGGGYDDDGLSSGRVSASDGSLSHSAGEGSRRVSVIDASDDGRRSISGGRGGGGGGRFQRDPLSSDLVSPSSPSQHPIKFRHRTSSSSHDSGISSQGTPHPPPHPLKGELSGGVVRGYEEECTYSLDSYGSRQRRDSMASSSTISSKKPKAKANKLRHRSRGNDTDPHETSSAASTTDSLLGMSEHLADYGILSPASPSPAPPTTRKLSRRQFHHSYFVRARYSAKLHGEKVAAKKQVQFKPPASLCPATRYSREARSTAPNKCNKTPRSNLPPQPPRYPSKARHAATECHILRLVETLDLGVQCVPETTTSHAQCTAATADSASQYPRARVRHGGAQTEAPAVRIDAAVQNVPSVRSRMVETSQRILYFPEILTAHAGAQTETDDRILTPSSVPRDNGTIATVPSPVSRDNGTMTTVSSSVLRDNGAIKKVHSSRDNVTTEPSPISSNDRMITTVPSSIPRDNGTITTVPSSIQRDNGTIKTVHSSRDNVTTEPSPISSNDRMITTVPSSVQADNSTMTTVPLSVQADKITAAILPSEQSLDDDNSSYADTDTDLSSDRPLSDRPSSYRPSSGESQTSTPSHRHSLTYQDSIDREKEKNKERLKEKEKEGSDVDDNYDSCSWLSGAEDNDSIHTCHS